MKINKESVLTVSFHTFRVEHNGKNYRASVTVNDRGRFTEYLVFESLSGDEASDEVKEEILKFLGSNWKIFKNKACNSRRVW